MRREYPPASPKIVHAFRLAPAWQVWKKVSAFGGANHEWAQSDAQAMKPSFRAVHSRFTFLFAAINAR